MKKIFLALFLAVLLPDLSYGAWLLWKHSLVTRRVEGTPRGLNPEGNVDRWELVNAVDTRKECLSALRAEHKKAHDALAAAYPNEPVSQSTRGDGVSSSISVGAEQNAPSAKTMQLYYQYTFWCLPPGVDPRTTRPK